MIVRNVSRGRSFKKLAAYLTQPREGNHRALWSSVENVGTDEPRTAAKVMASTALNADAIKAHVGGGKGGRKSDGRDVYHVVMSWTPGDKPDQAHQLEAARAMLDAAGFGQAQALIVAHNDNGVEHLHIMVNLVDPATGKRWSLSNDQYKMDAWATGYAQQRGTLDATPKRAEKVRAAAEGGPRPDRAEKVSRPTMDAIERAANADYKTRRADREAAFSRQAAERGELRAKHGGEWAQARKDADQHKRAYTAAFRAAYAHAKAEDKAANKPQWRALFRNQEADRASMVRAFDFAQQRATQARTEATKAQRAAVAAERRSKTLLGAIGRKLGLVTTPEQAAVRQVRAAKAMLEAARELTAAELAKLGLQRKHDAQRAALAKALGEVTFAKAQLQVDTMPRVDFAALVQRQEAERAATIAAHSAERDALGMKPYEPKTSRKDQPMTAQLADQDKARRSFAATTQPAAPQQDRPAVQAASRQLTPAGQSKGNTPAAPERVQQAAQARAGVEKVAPAKAFDQARKPDPFDRAGDKLNTPEAKAARAKENQRGRARDDFDKGR